MIGGATTSRAHTAVKIDPAYDGVVVHVVDASRAVGVVADLLARPDEIAARTAVDYEALRNRHRDKDETLVPLDQARARATRLPAPTPPAPLRPGRHVVEPSIAELAEVIDWTPAVLRLGAARHLPADPGRPAPGRAGPLPCSPRPRPCWSG